MSANGHLRLAWQADCSGHPKLRDVMLTLALAESETTDPWVERCRTKLVRDRAGHFFSHFPTLADALGHDEVRKAVERLREKYPPARVEWLLLAGDSSRGRFTGRATSLAIVLHDLFGTPAEAEVRRDAPEPLRGPVARSRSTSPEAVSVAAAMSSRAGVLFPGGHSVVDAAPLGFGGPVDQSPGSAPSGEPSRSGVTSEDESVSNYYLAVLFSMALLLSLNPSQGNSGEWRKAG